MTLPATTPAPQIDAEMIATFVDVLFGYLDGPVPVRLLAETGTPVQPPKAFTRPCASLAGDLIAPAEAAARSSRAVYLVPGTVDPGRSGKAEDIQSTGVVLVDLDEGDIAQKRKHLEHHLGCASMVVASGGYTEDGQEKLHLYWRLTEAAEGNDLERVRLLRERIAALVAGDSSFKSLHQPIRVAGTIHGKHGRHALARIEATTTVEYELSDLADCTANMPPIAGSTATSLNLDVGKTGPSAADLTTRTIRAGAVDEVTRFQALSKVIGHWLRNARLGRCSIDEAWSAVVDYNAASISPPWDESRLRREFDALQRRDLETQEPPARPTDPQQPATQFSDDTLAALFVDREGVDWRHVAAWRAWFTWTGLCWQRDETGLVREQVRQACRAAAQACEKPNEVRRICSDKTISAVVRIAASDPSIAIRTSALDAHPMLLNTPAGVIDLETGEVREHDRDLLLTQTTAASPGSGCPRWTRFLEEITGGDEELQAYLKRLAGYLLTGCTSEQIFAFFHGGGANGKSVFIQTLASVLGDYAATATLDTFMASSTTKHLTELAGLRGARMVIVPETDPGRAWAEGRIKSVTGGETIRANFMHRDHFEFTPQFKLIVAGNHRPSLSGTGEAMQRRLHLVPFEVTIPPERRDTQLMAKLQDERDGILGWMLEGCAEWRAQGLSPPAVILSAAASYFAEEDLVGQWLEEACETGPHCKATAQSLFSSWSQWADAAGHPKGTKKTLGEALRQKGFSSGKVMRTRGWIGLRPAGRGPDAPEGQR
jgi:P4 family phage/plasmid primase-like protien